MLNGANFKKITTTRTKNMKHIKNFTLLLALSLVMGACSTITPISSGESTTSSTEPEETKWNKEQQELLLDFFGELLPYPSGFTGEVAMYKDELNGYPRLAIGNQTDEFSIENYNLELENKGWTSVYDYNGKSGLEFNGTTLHYCLKTASDGKSGYLLSYYFIEGTEESEYADATPGYSTICVYKNTSVTVSNAPYSEEDYKNFKSALTTLPPQLKLSEDSYIMQSSNDVITLSDFSALDLRKDNAEILKNNGFTLDENLSKQYGVYALNKTLEDGSSILASLDFYYGNYITLQYLPKIATHATWPSELTTKFEDKFNITIPEFKDENVDEYKSFVKNEITYIYQVVDEESSLRSDIEALLYNLGLSCDNNSSYYTDWNERYFVSLLKGYDENDNRIVGIVFGAMEKVHDFIYGNNELNAKIEKFLEKREIDNTIPSLDNLPDGSYRFEEDGYSINISFFDHPNSENINEIKEYLYNTFINACWYKGYSYDYDEYFESQDGKIGVGISLRGNVTTLSITEGSEEEHELVFEFEEKTKFMTPGEFADLDLSSSMCSPVVTIESSDSTIVSVTDEHSTLVSVADDAEIGKEVTIKATSKDINGNEVSATCVITIIPYYTPEDSVNAVATLYNNIYNLEGEEAVTVTSSVNEDDPYVTITTYSMLATLKDENIDTIAKAETFVEEKLIPLGFELLIGEEWVESTSDDGLTKYSISYFLNNEENNGSGIHLNFIVYFNADNKLIIEASAELKEEHWDDEEDDGDFDDLAE